jgi:hypothetical protein
MYGTLGRPRIDPILLPPTGVRHHRCHQDLLPQRRVLHRRDANSIKSTRSPRPPSLILCAAAGTAEHGLSGMAAPRFLSRTYPRVDSLPSISTSYRRPQSGACAVRADDWTRPVAKTPSAQAQAMAGHCRWLDVLRVTALSSTEATSNLMQLSLG